MKALLFSIGISLLFFFVKVSGALGGLNMHKNSHRSESADIRSEPNLVHGPGRVSLQHVVIQKSPYYFYPICFKRCQNNGKTEQI